MWECMTVGSDMASRGRSFWGVATGVFLLGSLLLSIGANAIDTNDIKPRARSYWSFSGARSVEEAAVQSQAFASAPPLNIAVSKLTARQEVSNAEEQVIPFDGP